MSNIPHTFPGDMRQDWLGMDHGDVQFEELDLSNENTNNDEQGASQDESQTEYTEEDFNG